MAVRVASPERVLPAGLPVPSGAAVLLVWLAVLDGPSDPDGLSDPDDPSDPDGPSDLDWSGLVDANDSLCLHYPHPYLEAG